MGDVLQVRIDGLSEASCGCGEIGSYWIKRRTSFPSPFSDLIHIYEGLSVHALAVVVGVHAQRMAGQLANT